MSSFVEAKCNPTLYYLKNALKIIIVNLLVIKHKYVLTILLRQILFKVVDKNALSGYMSDMSITW